MEEFLKRAHLSTYIRHERCEAGLRGKLTRQMEGFALRKRRKKKEKGDEQRDRIQVMNETRTETRSGDRKRNKQIIKNRQQEINKMFLKAPSTPT